MELEEAAGDTPRDLGDVRVLLDRPPLLSLFREELRHGEGSKDAESPGPPSFPKAFSCFVFFLLFAPPFFRPRFFEVCWGGAAAASDGMGGRTATAAVSAATADARLVARGERGEIHYSEIVWIYYATTSHVRALN